MNAQVKLPSPKGRYHVGFFDGVFSYNYNDEERTLGYRCYYPAAAAVGELGRYYVDNEMLELFIDANSMSPLKDYVKGFTDLITHSYKNTPIIKSEKHLKVILYSHSFGSLTWSNLIQIEELASQGYVVVAISHTRETFCTILGSRKIGLDKNIQENLMGDLTRYIVESGRTDPFVWTTDEIAKYLRECTYAAERVKVWIADTVGMMDELENINKNKEHIFFDKLDCSGFGAFGLSLGGAASVNTPIYDKRIVAAINLDGWQLGADLLDHKLDIPGLFITKFGGHYEGNYGPHNDLIGCLTILGSSNLFMSDFCVLIEEEVKGLEVPNATIEGKLMSEIVTDFILNFFNYHVKGDHSVTLNDLCKKYKGHVMLK